MLILYYGVLILYCEVLILYYWVLILYCEVLILYYWVLIRPRACWLEPKL